VIPGDLNLEQLEDFIMQLYPGVPELGRVGFLLAKAQGRLRHINDGANAP